MIYTWPYKYIHSSDGNSELYHLDYDVKESVNLIRNKAELVGEMRAELEAFLKKRQRFEEKTEQPALTDDEIKKLKSLGYIGD